MEDDDDEDVKYSNIPYEADGTNLRQKRLQIAPTTRLTFLDRQYRLVYCIDMSPSMTMVVSSGANFWIFVFLQYFSWQSNTVFLNQNLVLNWVLVYFLVCIIIFVLRIEEKGLSFSFVSYGIVYLMFLFVFRIAKLAKF